VVGYRGSQPVHGEAPPEVLSYQIWYCQRYPGLKRRWSFWGEKEKRYFGWQVSFEVWMGIGWKGEVSPLDGRKRCRCRRNFHTDGKNTRDGKEEQGEYSECLRLWWRSKLDQFNIVDVSFLLIDPELWSWCGWCFGAPHHLKPRVIIRCASFVWPHLH
jgi:hypothetical protein